MQAAMMPVTASSLGHGHTTAAVESAVDAYATRVLQTKSPPEAFIDTSLGPYVTQLLRCAEIREKDQVTGMAEFDSLLELLEDQCNMERDVATDALKTIAKAVCTGDVPDHEASHSHNNHGHSGGLYYRGGFDTLESLKTALPDVSTSSNSSKPEPMSFPTMDPSTPNAAGGPSPMKPDNLIPFDLLGVLDDDVPSPQLSRHVGQVAAMIQEQQMAQMQSSRLQETKNMNDEDAFPPLGAAKDTKPKKAGRGKKGTKTHSDKDLAAALFRPARPRQNSVASEKEDSPQLQPAAVPAADRFRNASNNNIYFQQQLDSCVEILLSMNTELSEEAAAEAGMMANTDFNIAQYIVDAAMTAPPVCRHMLHEGCYRSDCQFSHDVEGHTCLFWLRGRCGKGTTCKFLHGFNNKILDGISMEMSSIASQNGPPPPGYQQSPYSSFQPGPTQDSLSGFSLPPRSFEGNQQPSSWQSSASGTGTSFANIASRGYETARFVSPAPESNGSSSSPLTVPTVRIPQDLWNPHENRDAGVFHVPDPIERYNKVAATVNRNDVIDLHFQSTKTFSIVLSAVLPMKLAEIPEVWLVTGTGHHVGSKTHQKGGGALERAVVQWLLEEGYNFAKGRDRNGLGGAILVKR